MEWEFSLKGLGTDMPNWGLTPAMKKNLQPYVSKFDPSLTQAQVENIMSVYAQTCYPVTDIKPKDKVRFTWHQEEKAVSCSFGGLKYVSIADEVGANALAKAIFAYTLDDIETQIKDRAKYESAMIRPNYVKIFSDGSPGDRTSLLLEHYVGEPGFLGQANMSTEEFAKAFIKFDKMGVGVHVHSIGEGSIRRVVDALEKMKEANGDSGVRHKIAHCWMITPEDLARVAKMKDVNIDFSPHIPYPHVGVSALYPPRIGKERYSKMFPVKTAIEAGLHVGQGADWLTANPTPNPFPAIEGFVTRMNPDDPNMGTLNPSEAVSLRQAIRICTIEGAWVLGAEDELGSIENGKFADMIVLDQNLFDLEKAKRLDRIGLTRVLKTIVGGKVVYDVMAKKK